MVHQPLQVSALTAPDHRQPRIVVATALSLALAVPFATLGGCAQAPGDEPEQGAVIGGLAGAAAGAAVAGDEDRLAGALIGAVLGAGGGYLIGQQVDKKNEQEAREAAEKARANPASADAARQARTADVDNNGFVTVDEVIAMEQAGMTDEEMLEKLRATDQVFELGNAERDQLAQAGVSDNVIQRMPELNRDKLPRPTEEGRLSTPSRG